MNVLMRTFGVPRCTIPVRENASKGGREFPRPLVQASHMSSSLTGRVVVGAGCLGMILMEIEKDEKEENSALVVAEQKNITPPLNPISEETLKAIRAQERFNIIKSITTDPKSMHKNALQLDILRRKISSDEAVSYVAEIVEHIVLLDENALIKESLAEWVFLLKNLNDKSYDKFLKIMVEKNLITKLMNTKEFYYSSTHFRSHIELKADIKNVEEEIASLSKK